MFVNPKTGYVALKYLGAPDPASNDPNNPDREGHAGAGLRVGEVKGFDLKTAQWLVSKGWAEEVPEDEVKASIAADEAAGAEAKAADDAVRNGLAAVAANSTRRGR